VCKLRKCKLNAADCTALDENLWLHKSLETIDLSDNYICDSSVKPLCHTLASCRALSKVDLSWNNLHKGFVVELIEPYAKCRLRTLLLGHNGLGSASKSDYDGILSLSQCLTQNTSLTELDVSYNRVGPSGAIMLASSLTRNGTLVLVNLDGNPVGFDGGRALIRTQLGSQPNGEAVHTSPESNGEQRIDPIAMSADGCTARHLSLLNCAFDERLGLKAFDPTNPNGVYNLNLSVAYDLAIAVQLGHAAYDPKLLRWNWTDVTLDGRPFAMPSNPAEFTCPTYGQLRLTFSAQNGVMPDPEIGAPVANASSAM
jgi:hypothetical protein